MKNEIRIFLAEKSQIFKDSPILSIYDKTLIAEISESYLKKDLNLIKKGKLLYHNLSTLVDCVMAFYLLYTYLRILFYIL